MGMGIKSISSAFHLSRNTVRKYVRKYHKLLFSIKKSHIYKFYRNAHYRNDGYDDTKVQIILSLCNKFMVFMDFEVNKYLQHPECR